MMIVWEENRLDKTAHGVNKPYSLFYLVTFFVFSFAIFLVFHGRIVRDFSAFGVSIRHPIHAEFL
jgi:hypothetical protein